MVDYSVGHCRTLVHPIAKRHENSDAKQQCHYHLSYLHSIKVSASQRRFHTFQMTTPRCLNQAWSVLHCSSAQRRPKQVLAALLTMAGQHGCDACWVPNVTAPACASRVMAQREAIKATWPRHCCNIHACQTIKHNVVNKLLLCLSRHNSYSLAHAKVPMSTAWSWSNQGNSTCADVCSSACIATMVAMQ